MRRRVDAVPMQERGLVDTVDEHDAKAPAQNRLDAARSVRLHDVEPRHGASANFDGGGSDDEPNRRDGSKRAFQRTGRNDDRGCTAERVKKTAASRQHYE